MKKVLSKYLVAVLFLAGSMQPVKAAETIINSKGQKAEVYTSSDTTTNNFAKGIVSVSFIEDPNNNRLTALVSLKGFIPAQLIKTGIYSEGYMYWPSKYSVSVKSIDANNQVKMLESIPKNKIETVTVTETMGYSIGGNISVQGSSSGPSGSGGGNFSVNVQRSIKYEQPDFKTIQTNDDLDSASWDIIFNSTRDGYDRNSYHVIYGNQMFMKSRLHNTGINNLVDTKDLSPLISGGFSPDMVVALSAPKGTKKSKLQLNYTMYRDFYSIKWYSSGWWGKNDKTVGWNPSEMMYEIDWENHTVTALN